MKKLLILILCSLATHLMAQQSKKDSLWTREYRSFYPKTNELIHTKLNARFDYTKSEMLGNVWLTLKPHFYRTDFLVLDAKGMAINKVELVNAGKKIPLTYTYDSMQLKITLDKMYNGGESYTVYIDYQSRPNQIKVKGSQAITDAKGLYFINPKGEDKTKPIQIWTQGETEANSVWIPTIDKPNQKTTTEFYLTVPSKYVTLSNGKLISQIKNSDGTRTDLWKMELPHAPYLMFMGIGEFSIVRDFYKGKEVNYYVEKEYEKQAKKIFGLTPEMMKFFSERVTGVEYPWVKYSQIVGRDYVSGAMENTTATLHQSAAQQNARELIDGNIWEDVISHELFHQWFGDLVTAESWSNITVNESFADYSEYLWREYKYGADEAGRMQSIGLQQYLGNPADAKKDLVRYYYADKEDVFDQVSYPKGGRILHMLRHEVGDKAFYASLNLYLTTNKFGTGNARKLQLAFEAVTGKDLNWYFSQWYFGSGHPIVDINYLYNPAMQEASVIVKQTQDGEKIFALPIDIDIYSNGQKNRTSVWVSHKTDTFKIHAAAKPDLINMDGDKVLLWNKTDHKTPAEFIHQYTLAKTYADRKEAIDYFGKHKNSPEAIPFLTTALSDPFFRLRILALRQLTDSVLNATLLNKVELMAKTDASRLVRAAAVDILSLSKDIKYLPLYMESVKDSSYTVSGYALLAISKLDEQKAISLLPELKKDARGRLKISIEAVETLTKGDKDFDEMTKAFAEIEGLVNQYNSLPNYIDFLSRVNTTRNFKKGFDIVIAFREKTTQYGVTSQVNNLIKEMTQKKQARKVNTAAPEEIDKQLEYVSQFMK